ncbi:MAG: tRNA (guanosine(37)-N1)-methyltransferase TrmD [Armatimonadota bacterium]
MRIDVVTIFPGMFDGPLNYSITKRALDRGLVEIHVHDLRDYARDRHRVVDDYPYGGGAGMVMKPEPWFRAIEAISGTKGERAHVVLLTPQGHVLTQDKVRELARRPRLLLMCGRYEGVDERVREALVDEEVSIGDFIVSGGEVAALVVIEAVIRLVPGVVGNEESPADESFSAGLLEYPQYTRPSDYRGLQVPEVLLSGHHEQIRRWRRREALRRTRDRRPDLFDRLELTSEDRALLEETAPAPSRDAKER